MSTLGVRRGRGHQTPWPGSPIVLVVVDDTRRGVLPKGPGRIEVSGAGRFRCAMSRSALAIMCAEMVWIGRTHVRATDRQRSKPRYRNSACPHSKRSSASSRPASMGARSWRSELERTIDAACPIVRRGDTKTHPTATTIWPNAGGRGGVGRVGFPGCSPLAEARHRHCTRAGRSRTATAPRSARSPCYSPTSRPQRRWF